MGGIVELVQQVHLGAEEDIQAAVHADGGGEDAQPVQLDRLPVAVRLQNGIAQFIQHETDFSLAEACAAGNPFDQMPHLPRGFALDLGPILADGGDLPCHIHSLCLLKRMIFTVIIAKSRRESE